MKFSPKTKLADRIFLWCILVSLFVSLTAGVCGWMAANDRLTTQYGSEAKGVVLAALSKMQPEDVGKWISDGKQDDTYEAVRKDLDALLNASGAETVYALICDSGTGERALTYVYRLQRGASKASAQLGDPVLSGAFDKTLTSLYNSASALSGKSWMPQMTRNERDGKSYITAYMPLCDENGAVICIIGAEIPGDGIAVKALSAAMISTGGALLLMSVASYILILILKRRVSLPIARMLDSAENYIEQMTNAEDPSKADYNEVLLETRDEVAQLSDRMNRMAQALQKATKDYSTLVDNKKSVTDEVALANRIMRNLYPAVYPAFPGHTEFDVFAEFRTDYSGRYCFYDYFMTDEKHLCIMVGETSGSGVPSMIYAVLASANIRSFARLGYAPHRIAVETNNLLSANNSEGITVSAIIALVDLSDGTMTYVNAGQPDLLVKRAGNGFAYLKQKQNFVLAGMENVTFTQNRAELMQGDMVLMFTSTIPETLNAAGQRFGEDAVRESVNNYLGETYNLPDLVGNVGDSVDRFRGGKRKDMTSLLMFRYLG